MLIEMMKRCLFLLLVACLLLLMLIPEASAMMKNGQAQCNNVWYWPVPGNPVISSPYNIGAQHLIDIRGSIHRGIDIPGAHGVVASRDGTATVFRCGCFYRCSHNGGFGNLILIDHGNSTVSAYAHLQPDILIDDGWVNQGQHIAISGSSGNSSGNHLHFEIRVDIPSGSTCIFTRFWAGQAINNNPADNTLIRGTGNYTDEDVIWEGTIEYLLSDIPPEPPEPPEPPVDDPPPPPPPPPLDRQWQPPLASNRFYDVPDVPDWRNAAVSWADRNDITTGSPAGSNTFRPEAPVTRAEFVTFLHRIFGSPDAPSALFGDMPGNEAFQNAISWALAEGITTGSPAGSNTFMPNDNITREQIAAMLYRYIGNETPAPEDRLGDYADRDMISTWAGARDAVNWAVYNGIMGVDTTTLNPGGNATRAEAVTMLYRVVDIFGIPAP